MKKVYNFIIAALIISTITFQLPAERNIDKHTEQICNKEGKAIGILYWTRDKKHVKKACVHDDEYIDTIMIKEKDIKNISAKKLKKGKVYIGMYYDTKNNEGYYVYGHKKHTNKPKQKSRQSKKMKHLYANEEPDSDVVTVIAIEEDYGPGE